MQHLPLVQDTEELLKVLQCVSATVMTIDSKLTQVTTAIDMLSDRQDRIEAKLDHLTVEIGKQTHQHLFTRSVAPHPREKPPTVPTSQHPPAHPNAPYPSKTVPTSQHPPVPTSQHPPVPQPSAQATAPLHTSAFESPSLLWYENPPSFTENTQQENNSREYLDHAAVMSLRNNSTSRKNFAACIVRRIFTEAERSTSNVNGKNKAQLDPHRIGFVKQKVFQMYPLLSGETTDKVWAECVAAIDEANRRLNRKSKL